MTYAAKTKVPADRSRSEIEQVLRRYGADQFLTGYDSTSAFIGFTAKGRQVRFILPLPKVQRQSDEQVVRQRWRALLLCIKAKLETVASGISSFESEFLSHVVLPDGKTVADHVIPHIALAYESGKMPALLPAYSGEE